MLKACAYDIRKAPIRDLLISIHKTRDFEWQTAHTKGCQENRCVLGPFIHFTSLSRIYLSRIVEKVPKNLSSYAPDQDEGNKQQCN